MFINKSRWARRALVLVPLLAALASSAVRADSLLLDGVNDFVNVPDSASVRLTGPLTVEAWINRAASGVQHSVVEKYGCSGLGGYVLRVTPANKVLFGVRDDCNAGTSLTGGATIPANVWTHIAGVWDGAALRIYVNGVLDGTLPNTRPPRPGTTPLKIGARGNDSATTMNGRLDEVRIWNVARTGAQIADNRTLCLAGTESGLAAYWRFDETAGLVAADRTSNGNAGTLMNGPTWSSTPGPVSCTPPLPVITVAASGEAAEPNVPGQFRLSRTGSTASDLEVFVNMSGTAGNGTDYATIEHSVVFAAGQSTTLVTVSPLDDAVNEGDETVTLTLDASFPGYIVGNPANATIALREDDFMPAVSIAVPDGITSEPGSDNGRFRVTRAGSVALPLTVSYAIRGSANNGTDYAPLTGSVQIPGGQKSVEIPVTILDDVEVERSETVSLVLLPGSGYSLGYPANSTLTIRDDEIPPVINVTANLTNILENSGGTVEFTITRSGPTTDPLTVNFVFGGTGAEGIDYPSPGSSAFIPAGQSSVVVGISVNDDTLPEGNETVIMSLAATLGYELGANSQAAFTIEDDEIPSTITIAAADPTAGEGGGNNGLFTITRSGSSASDLLVNYAVAGSAANGIDYNLLLGAVTIPAGASSADIPLEVLEDLEGEGAETVVLGIQPNASYVVGSPNIATVTIADNDSSPGGPPGSSSLGQALQFDGIDDVVTIPDSPSVRITGPFTIEAWIKRDVTGVQHSIVEKYGCAGLGGYILRVAPTDKLQFGTRDDCGAGISVFGGTSIPANVWTHVAGVWDGANLTVYVNGALDGTFASTKAPNIGTTPLKIGLRGNDTATGHQGAIDEVRLWNVARTAAQINDNKGLCLAGSETGLAGYWKFDEGAGAIAADATANANHGALTDPVRVEGIVACGGIVSPPSPGLPLVRLAVSQSLTAEFFPDGIHAIIPGVFTIWRQGSTAGDLTVNYTIGGTALNGIDYQGLSGLITIPAGSPSVLVPIFPIDDQLIEGIETVTLALAPNSAYTVAGPSSATMDIEDNDPTVILEPTHPAGEGTFQGIFTVRRTGPVTSPLDVLIRRSIGTALNGVDFFGLPSVVTIPAGHSFTTILITAIQDTLVEGTETIAIQLDRSPAYTLGPFEAEILLEDDDVPDVDTGATIVSAVATAPDTFEFFPDGIHAIIPGVITLYRTGPTTHPVFVRCVWGGTAQNGLDYVGLPRTVTIPAGASQVNINVTPIDDFLIEPIETASIILLNGVGYTIGSSPTATVSIEDNDPTLNLEALDPVATESGATPGTFRLWRTGPTTSPLSATYRFIGTATPGGDYVDFGLVLTIPAGQSSTLITINPINDSALEGPETVALRLERGAGFTIGLGEAEVTIVDDDIPPPTPGTVRIAAGDPIADEELNNPGTFVVTRTGSTALPMMVHYSASGSAVNDADYRFLPGVIEIPAGATSATIVATPLDDAAVEGPESIILTLGIGPDYVIGSPSSATNIINDNDSITVTIAATDNAAAEEGTNPGNFIIRRTGPLVNAVTVLYTISGTATSGSDYAALGGSIIIPADTSEVNLPLTPVNDSLVESSETVILTLAANGAYIIGTPNSATVTIADNDVPAPPVGLGSALQLDGTNDLATVADSPSLRLTGPFTVEAWVRRSVAGVQHSVVEKYGCSGLGGYVLRITSADKVLFGTRDDCTRGVSVTGGTSVPANVWTHIAGTWDGATLRVYVNGTLDGSLASTTAPRSGATPLRIGARGNDLATTFRGLIDEVRIWNVARSGAALAANRGACLAGTEAGLVGYWQFEEGSGATASDLTVNANIASLANGALFAAPGAPVTCSPAILPLILPSPPLVLDAEPREAGRLSIIHRAEGVRLLIQGAPQGLHQIEYSKDLLNWQPLKSFSTITGEFEYVDESEDPIRFYRVMQTD